MNAGTPPMRAVDALEYLKQIPGWSLEENKIKKDYEFAGFKTAIEFVNHVADIAQEESHHPDIFISYSKVTLTLSTHASAGLTENDFILAAKIDATSPDTA